MLKIPENESNPYSEEQVDRSVFNIESIPLIIQRHTFWCGYTSLAMVLQYYDHKDITPERIYEQLHGKLVYENEIIRPAPRPDVDTLASLARELTVNSVPKLTSRIISGNDYERLGKNPHDVLQKFVKAKVPCIVRTPGHFKIVSGFYPNSNTYRFHDPFRGIQEIGIDDFASGWSEKDMGHDKRDARHLLLAVYPARKSV